jgi:hypothetical protein
LPVADTPRHRLHEFAVRDAVEIPAQVRIHDLVMAAIEQLLDLGYGVQTAPPLAVGVLLWLQVGLEDRLQDQQSSHLHDTILDRWYPQRSQLAVRLRDMHPSDGGRPIRLLAEFLRQFVQPPLQAVRPDVLERLPIDPGRPAVGEAAEIRIAQNVLAVHLVVQAVKPVVGRPFRFVLQRRL